MRKLTKILSVTLTLSVVIFMSSCITMQPTASKVVPRAFSSISKIHYIDDLKLSRENYKIINTETAEASVFYEEYVNKFGKDDGYGIGEVNGEFLLKYKAIAVGNDVSYKLDSHTGIIKYGTLTNDFSDFEYEAYSLAAGLATYRLINAVQDQGADAVIEPIVTVKLGQEGRKIIYTATISAKLIKINTK